MTTWSSGPFGNDGAAQWALTLKVTDDFAVIEHTLDGSFEEGRFMHGACPRGVAAVAALVEFLKYCQDPATPRKDEKDGQDILDSDWLRLTFARMYDVADLINAWVRARLEAGDTPSPALISKAAYFIEAVIADPDERSSAVDDGFVDEWTDELHELHATVVGALYGSPGVPGSIAQVAVMSASERGRARRRPRARAQARGSR